MKHGIIDQWLESGVFKVKCECGAIFEDTAVMAFAHIKGDK